jgi:hypothetical protein
LHKGRRERQARIDNPLGRLFTLLFSLMCRKFP